MHSCLHVTFLEVQVLLCGFEDASQWVPCASMSWDSNKTPLPAVLIQEHLLQVQKREPWIWCGTPCAPASPQSPPTARSTSKYTCTACIISCLHAHVCHQAAAMPSAHIHCNLLQRTQHSASTMFAVSSDCFPACASSACLADHMTYSTCQLTQACYTVFGLTQQLQ